MLNFLSYTTGTIPEGWFYSADFLFGIKKYAICILLGILAVYIIQKKEASKMGIKSDDLLKWIIIIVPLSILGARIMYMLTDNKDSFGEFYRQSGNFFKALFNLFMYTIGFDVLSNGSYSFVGISGLAIGGGIIVAFIMSIVACKVQKWNLRNVYDFVCPAFLLAQASGRWGNFFNREAYGSIIGGVHLEGSTYVANLTQAEQYAKLTKFVPKFIANNMCMSGVSNLKGYSNGEKVVEFVSGMNYVHPTFLYESLPNFLAFIGYLFLRRSKKVNSGLFTGLYLIWYGVLRLFIEHLRTDSLYFTNTTIKVYFVLCPIMIVAGIGYIIYTSLVKKEKYSDALTKGGSDDNICKES